MTRASIRVKMGRLIRLGQPSSDCVCGVRQVRKYRIGEAEPKVICALLVFRAE